MIGLPETFEEAKAYMYGETDDCKGVPYKEGKCAFAIWVRGGITDRQCSNGVKDGQLYCGKHAREMK